MSHSRFRVVPAAYVFLLRPGAEGGTEVLLQLRSGTGFMDDHWAASAAGHVEKGETVEEAVQREAVEELGIRDLVLTPLCAMQRTRPGPRGTATEVDERVDYFFTATSWSGEPRVAEPDKSADQRWFPLTALPDPVVPHELKVLLALRRGPVPPVMTYGF